MKIEICKICGSRKVMIPGVSFDTVYNMCEDCMLKELGRRGDERFQSGDVSDPGPITNVSLDSILDGADWFTRKVIYQTLERMREIELPKIPFGSAPNGVFLSIDPKLAPR